MKYRLLFLIYFSFLKINAQGEPKFTIKGAKKVEDQGYVSKRKALDCNKDLEWYQGSPVVYHKKSGKPFTGTCVAYYDNRKLERKTNFILGKENGECFTYYKNGNVKVTRIFEKKIKTKILK